jgi:hypothetical protein
MRLNVLSHFKVKKSNLLPPDLTTCQFKEFKSILLNALVAVMMMKLLKSHPDQRRK